MLACFASMLHGHVFLSRLVSIIFLGNVNTDLQLATAPTNGSVVLWDLQKMTKSKIGRV